MNMEESVLNEYREFVRFPSVGADPAHLKDTVDCATWLKNWFEKLDFSVDLCLPEKGAAAFAPPVVFATRPGEEGGATILVYGHYDVQPVDPIAEWRTPPFELTVVDERLYARGAQDDKGQLFAFLCGLRDFLAQAPSRDAPPRPTIKFVLDGQEESASAALTALAADATFRRRLAADVLLVCDTSAGAALRPAIVAGLRGVSHFTVRLTGSSRDLHSGEYGGIAPNAAQAIAELVASLHTPDGAIAVAGFREGIEPPTEEERRLAELGAMSEAAYADEIGCEPVGGQVGKTIVERNSFQPTIEVNGLHSGYAGPGAKTIIPSTAYAKISMRLVPGQSPNGALAAVKRHLEANVPRGMKLTFEEADAGAPAFRLPLASPVFRLAVEVLTEMDARGPVFQWDGASIPVLSVLREASGAAPLIVGWGQSEDCIHAPNESYSFVQFAKAREWAGRILSVL